jgi:hypothetical protein
LFRSAPIPLDDTDENFPVSLSLLPQICIVNLMGGNLVLLFNRRLNYRNVFKDEMIHAEKISHLFVNRYPNKMFSITKRKVIKKPSINFSSSGFIDGLIYGIIHAKFVSVNLFLLSILEQFDEEIEKKKQIQRKLKQTVCDVCGAFQLKLSVCSKCKNRRFCSTLCQKKDWPKHKVFKN